MYPLDILTMFPPFPRTNTVFVAMSFDTRFDATFAMFERAAQSVVHGGAPLSAYRVDLTKKSDSILTEIVKHVADARLILADISTFAWSVDGSGTSRPMRNANVMYEVGLAHAARLPEEVIVVRGDSDKLDFDIQG